MIGIKQYKNQTPDKFAIFMNKYKLYPGIKTPHPGFPAFCKVFHIPAIITISTRNISNMSAIRITPSLAKCSLT